MAYRAQGPFILCRNRGALPHCDCTLLHKNCNVTALRCCKKVKFILVGKSPTLGKFGGNFGRKGKGGKRERKREKEEEREKSGKEKGKMERKRREIVKGEEEN